MKPRVTPEFRRGLVDAALLVGIVVFVVLGFCAISITTDVRAMRTTQIEEAAAFRTGPFARVDQTARTAEEVVKYWRVFIDRFDSQLTNVRSQVKESGEDTQKQTKEAIAKTTAVVTRSLEQTDKVIDAVADKPSPVVPVVHVEPAAPPNAPIIITPLPAPPGPPAETPPPAAAPEKKGFFKKIWPPWKH